MNTKVNIDFNPGFIMDKSWISKQRHTDEYLIGLSQFLDFAFENGAIDNTIRCPYPKCVWKYRTRDIVEDHLKFQQFPKNYVTWNLHGEREVPTSFRNENIAQKTHFFENSIETMVKDAFGHYKEQETNIDESHLPEENEGPNEDSSDFHEFINNGNQTLHEGSKYTKLEFLLKLYHIKILCGLSDKALTMILDLLREAFQQAKLPPSFYEAKKIINKLGLKYTKIDACPNDCMLYLGDDEKELNACKHCGTSR